MTSVLQLSLLFLEEEAFRIQQWLPLVPVTLDQYIAYPISFPKENLQCFPGKAMRGQNAATSRCRDYRDQIFRVDFRDPKRVELRKWAFNTGALANLGNNARDAVTTGALPGTFRSLLEDEAHWISRSCSSPSVPCLTVLSLILAVEPSGKVFFVSTWRDRVMMERRVAVSLGNAK